MYLSKLKVALTLVALFGTPALANATVWYHRGDAEAPRTPPGAPTASSTNLSTEPSTFMKGAYNAKVGTIQADFIRFTDPPPCFVGQTTFIWWENLEDPIESIAAGKLDNVIKAFGDKVCPETIIAPFHEFNLTETPWAGKPAVFIAAWKRIHEILGNRVRYAWVANNWTTPNSPAVTDYWPGNDQVDIVGIDAFSWNGESLASILDPVLAQIAGWGKPLWLTSTGTGQMNQAAWITAAIATAKRRGLEALIYFSRDDRAAFHLNAEGLAALK